MRARRVDSDQNKEKAEDEILDESNETGVFVCRWRRGDCSVVIASTKRHAIVALGEWHVAEPEMLQPLKKWMLDLKLSDSADPPLRFVGKETRNIIFDTCYPSLDQFLSTDASDDCYSKAAPKERRERAPKLLRSSIAVRKEKSRLQKSFRTQEKRDARRCAASDKRVHILN
jgi:hypothetical protein